MADPRPVKKTPKKRAKKPKARSGRTNGAKTPDDRRLVGSTLLRERGADSVWMRYIEGVSLGMNKGDCAAYAGIGDVTVRLWRTNAEDDEREERDSVFREFFVDVASARSKLLAKNLATIETARGDGDWKAASWLLERLGYHRKTEIEGEVKGTLTYIIDTQDEGA